jgi:hypothetical protein
MSSFSSYASATAAPATGPAGAPNGGKPQSLPYAAPSQDTIPLTSTGLDMLRQTRPWVAFVSIVMTVSCILMLGLGAFGMVMASQHRNPQALGMFAVYIGMAVVYLIPAGYLRKYAAGIRQLMEGQSAEDLTVTLAAQKSFWRVVGILTAILVAIYAVVLFMAVTAVGLGRLFR